MGPSVPILRACFLCFKVFLWYNEGIILKNIMSVLDITLRQFLQFAIYALPAVLFWYFLFRFQNKRALPREVIRDTFFIGIFSVVPLLTYQYVYTHWFPSLSAQYLGSAFTEHSFMYGVSQIIFGFMTLGVSFLVLIGLFTILYSLFTKESLFNTLRAFFSEPLNFSATSIILIIILIIEMVLKAAGVPIPAAVIGSTFLLAMLEEYSKHLIVRLFDDNKIKNIANAIELSIVVALSFAFLENIIYLSSVSAAPVQNLIVGRSIISMFGHVIFSAIFGFYYGLSKFAKPVFMVKSMESHVPGLPAFLYRIFRFKTHEVFKAQKIFEGLVFASLLHFVFNLCLQFNLFLGVLTIIMAGGYLVFLLLGSDLVQRQWSVIGSKAMPSTDFEKLAWKISILKHLEAIKKSHPDTKETSK